MDNNLFNFDCNKITKYFKNQIPVDASKLSSQYIDDFFKPDENSLLALDSNGNPIGNKEKMNDINASSLTWKSAADIFYGQQKIFVDQIEHLDIKQGSLGDCYFLSAVAALTEFPYLITQIFRSNFSISYGYFEIVLFIDGEWQIVILDDYLPVYKSNGSLCFSKANGNELWVVLLEKAWAKVNSGYRNIIAGYENQALNALTGFPSERYNTSTNSMNVDELWKLITKFDRLNSVMCATTTVDNSISDLGLVACHAYSLIGAIEIPHEDKTVKLVQIRNPWGYKEWNGDWSDYSNLWNSESKKAAKLEQKDDGLFYMCIEDFQKYFHYTSICSIMKNAFVKNESFELNSSSPYPYIYGINIEKNTTLGISAINKHYRFNRNLEGKPNGTHLILCKYDNNSLTLIDSDWSEGISVDLIKDLSPANYVLWVWNDLKNSESDDLNTSFKTKKVNVCLTGSENFSFRFNAVDKDYNFLQLIIYNHLKNTRDISADNCSICENMFHNSGIGYRFIKNGYDQWNYQWKCNSKSVQNMSTIVPYINTDEFNVIVKPKKWGFILANRIIFYSQYWFNYETKAEFIKCNDDEVCKSFDEMTNFENEIYKKSTLENVPFDSKDNKYFYTLTEKIFDNKNYVEDNQNSKNIEESAKSKLYKSYPELMAKLDNFPNHPDEDKLNLTWGELKYSTCNYIGQINKNNLREGKGILIFPGDTGYMSHYLNNKRNGKCITWLENFFVSYDGEVKDDKNHGKGTRYYKAGSWVVGNFENGILKGDCTNYWSVDSYWVGKADNDKLHGDGIYYNNGTSRSVRYENNQPVS